MYFSNGDSNVNVYHSKNLNVKKSKSHSEKLGKVEKPKQGRRYSSGELSNRRGEIGVPISNSFQENLSKICEATDPDDESNENSVPPSPPETETAETTTDQPEVEMSKKYTAKSAFSTSSSFDSEDGFGSRKASISDDDALISVGESGSPKKKSNFEKTKNRLHKGLKKFSLTTDGLFSNPNGGRRMSLPAFASMPDFKSKASNVKSPVSGDKTLKTDSEKSQPASAIYVNMVDEKPELFAPLDSKYFLII